MHHNMYIYIYTYTHIYACIVIYMCTLYTHIHIYIYIYSLGDWNVVCGRRAERQNLDYGSCLFAGNGRRR